MGENNDYHLYVLSTNHVTQYRAIDKQNAVPVNLVGLSNDTTNVGDSFNYFLTPKCVDTDNRGSLLVDVRQKTKDREDQHFIMKINGELNAAK